MGPNPFMSRSLKAWFAPRPCALLTSGDNLHAIQLTLYLSDRMP